MGYCTFLIFMRHECDYGCFVSKWPLGLGRSFYYESFPTSDVEWTSRLVAWSPLRLGRFPVAWVLALY